MPRVTRFDRTTCRDINAAINRALADVAAQFNISIHTGRGAFTPGAYSVKVECGIITEAGTVIDANAEHFRMNAPKYGLLSSDLGRLFLYENTTFRLVGSRSKAPRFPLIGERVPDGKRMAFTLSGVRNNFVEVTVAAERPRVTLRQRPEPSGPEPETGAARSRSRPVVRRRRLEMD